MRLELTGRHVTITPALRRLVARQMAPSLRMLNDSAVSAQVVLSREKARHRAEVTLHARGDHFLRGAGLGRDLTSALAGAFSKIERQADTLKGKWEARRRRVPRTTAAEPVAPEVPALRVVRARRYAVKPMSIEDAAQVLARGTETFLVFRHVDDETILVLFRRADGHLGLIEPEG